MASVSASAQLFTPVQVQLYAPPPYSHFLTDYASSTSQRLLVSLLLLDLQKSGLEVSLRIVLESNTVRIATRPDYRGTPHYLNGGLTLNLS